MFDLIGRLVIVFVLTNGIAYGGWYALKHKVLTNYDDADAVVVGAAYVVGYLSFFTLVYQALGYVL